MSDTPCCKNFMSETTYNVYMSTIALVGHINVGKTAFLVRHGTETLCLDNLKANLDNIILLILIMVGF